MLSSPLFQRYQAILLRENAKMNLTAITDPAEIQQKHFADSLFLLEEFGALVRPGATLLDVGSGAGFPGAPLAIARQDLRVTLLEATAKKAGFLRMLGEELALSVSVVHARAEAAAHQPALRETFDVVVSRAVAPLPVLCELCLPFVRVGGYFAAYKGTEANTLAELESAAHAMEILGANIHQVASKSTSYGERSLIMLQKISHTPSNCPRNHAMIVKRPL